MLRHRKRHQLRQFRQRHIAPQEPVVVHEKAQLHSDDIKPDRQELEGSGDMLVKKQTEFAEMPANELFVKDKGEIMSSNTPASHETEATGSHSRPES